MGIETSTITLAEIQKIMGEVWHEWTDVKYALGSEMAIAEFYDRIVRHIEKKNGDKSS